MRISAVAPLGHPPWTMLSCTQPPSDMGLWVTSGAESALFKDYISCSFPFFDSMAVKRLSIVASVAAVEFLSSAR